VDFVKVQDAVPVRKCYHVSYLRKHDEHWATDESVSFSNIQIRSYLGTLDIEICDSCGYLFVHCIHEFNTWQGDESNAMASLICNLCGVDGT
jgi:hypothetical protein